MDQKIIWEQSVSLLINELGFSSRPHVEIKRNKKLHTCRQLPAPSCCYPGSFWEAQSLRVWGRSQEAGTPPNVHSDLGSSRQSIAPGLFCHTDTGWGEESALADKEPCPACSLTQVMITKVTKQSRKDASGQSTPRERWPWTQRSVKWFNSWQTSNKLIDRTT